MRRAVAVLPLVLLASCKDEPKPVDAPKPAPFVAPTGVSDREVEPPPALAFTDVTKAAGVDFVHETGADGRKLLPETMGSGCAFFDLEGDGDPDLLLLSGAAWPDRAGSAAGAASLARLWRNDGGWKFSEVRDAPLSALSYVMSQAMGVACADTDGDGDTDLVVTGVGGYAFVRNDGGKLVVVPPKESGLAPPGWKDATGREHGPFATSAAFTDVDGDGFADLFVCHYVHWSVETDVFSTLNGKDKTYATPDVYAGESCRLWRNLGGNRFEDVTVKSGLLNDDGKSLGVAVTDLDGDRRPDFVIANDKQPNYVWCQREGGRFEECGTGTGIAYGPDGRARAGMGIDAAVVGEKDRTFFAIGNFSGEPVGLWEWRGTIFTNKSDVARIAEPTLPSLTFAVRFLDADLDGRQDLVIANGHIEPSIQEIHADIPYPQRIQFLRQLGDGTFTELRTLGPAAETPRVHRGVATADVDGDGDLDLCVTVNGGAPVLLRCDLADASKRSLRVRVEGKAPATDALGAVVVVKPPKPGAGRMIQRVTSGAGYLCDSERTLTFGLGASASPVTVEVTWPDGHSRTFEGVGPGLLRAVR
ncbi:MAG: hypothetical protein HMLKMBBP_03528 [Planctomycetes bacterium]|nr:hypothetical protein [Planctomycetota bacterium]